MRIKRARICWNTPTIKLRRVSFTSPVILALLLSFIPLLYGASPSSEQGNPKTADSQSLPAGGNTRAGDLYALAVGVSRYSNPKVPALRVSHKDAEDVAAFLKTQDKLFKNVHIQLLTNEKATKAAVEQQLYYKLRRAGKNDTIILFFSGHGADDPYMPGEFFFLAYDSDPENLQPTGINMSGLRFISRLESQRVVLIADACHAGGFSREGAKNAGLSLRKFASEFGESFGRVIITSSRPDQVSLEDSGMENSVFTHYLLQALSGKADSNHDGVVSLDEAYRYMYEKTKDHSQGIQHPQMEGRLVGTFPLSLARLHPGTHPPAPLKQENPNADEHAPDDLASAIRDAEKGDSNAQFKLGLMYEFGLRLSKNHDEAVKWYRKAAAQGHKDADQALVRIMRTDRPNQGLPKPGPTVEIDWSAHFTDADMKSLEFFSKVAAIVSKNYVTEVSKEVIYRSAIDALLKSTKQPIPDDFQSELQKKFGSEKNELKRFGMALKVVQSNFLGGEDMPEVVKKAINGSLRSLDPHSSFLTKEMFQELAVETKGEFSGIGCEITIEKGILTIVAPIEGSPGFRAGLQAGDKITKINGEPTEGFSLLQAVKLMRGPKGSTVALTIRRPGLDELKKFLVKRDIIRVSPVRQALLEPGYVYVKIINFAEGTNTQFSAAIEQAGGAEHIKGVVLDLRNNPGGLLDQSVKIANMFVENGIIVYTDGRMKNQKMEFRATKSGPSYKFKVAVLVNRGTSSGSEILASALQDHDRAVLFGSSTFGKASVQTIIPLDSGQGIRLTTAYYFTPRGRQIQGIGVKPDVDLTKEIEREQEQHKMLTNSVTGDTARPDATPHDDIALKTALEWLKSEKSVLNYKSAK